MGPLLMGPPVGPGAAGGAAGWAADVAADLATDGATDANGSTGSTGEAAVRQQRVPV